MPRWLNGDPTRVRQILTNLVGNAVKFTEQGEVVVRVTSEGLRDDAIRLNVAVSDTGIGIPMEAQALVFDVFSQADGSTTRKFGGTGLGLVISKRLSELMGGTMWVESEEGKGSSFYVKLRGDENRISEVELLNSIDK